MSLIMIYVNASEYSPQSKMIECLYMYLLADLAYGLLTASSQMEKNDYDEEMTPGKGYFSL